MHASIDDIVSGIDAISSVTDERQLKTLQTLLDSFFEHPEAGQHLDVCFRVFERFPDDDGFGVFWAIVHGLECFPGYDAMTVASVQRQPSRFPLLLINRMINGGASSVSGVDLVALLETVAENRTCPKSVAGDAAGYVTHQRAKA